MTRPTAIAAAVGIAIAALFDVLWVNLFVAGIGGLLLGVFWMPVLAALLFAARRVREHWSSIAAFALTYAPTQFLVRAFIHEPSARWPVNEILVVLWSNLWFAVILGAAAIGAWCFWSKPNQVVPNDA
jgi:hypothetical protein